MYPNWPDKARSVVASSRTLMADLPAPASSPEQAQTLPSILEEINHQPLWRVLRVQETTDHVDIFLVRRPDVVAPHYVYIRVGWRIIPAVAEAWLHYERQEEGTYRLSRKDFGYLESSFPLALLWNQLLYWGFPRWFLRYKRARQRRSRGKILF